MKNVMTFQKGIRGLGAVCVLFGLTSCNTGSVGGSGSNSVPNSVANSVAGNVMGQDFATTTSSTAPSQTTSTGSQLPAPTPSPPSPPAQNPPAPPTTALGDPCHTDDPNHSCLALKYVVYEDSKGNAAISQSVALNNLKIMNSIWNQCEISFQYDQYLEIDPTTDNLRFSPANDSELTDIRQTFVDKKTLLVVTTGAWNRSGSLGSTGANAWTTMPGGGALGVVLEAPVGDYPNIIAHELGHYLGLDHVSDSSDLMSPIIYTSSTHLTSSQCGEAQNIIATYWKGMLR